MTPPAVEDQLIRFLCRLTPAQWRAVNRQTPLGCQPTQPALYTLAGVYEGSDNLWIVRRNGSRYQFWPLGAVFRLDPQTPTAEFLEMGEALHHQAAALRQQAAALIEEAAEYEKAASDIFNHLFFGAE